ncbi:MAG: hypothetical protein WCA27_14905 [Candidatus Sulfotelmatobacter sp.]
MNYQQAQLLNSVSEQCRQLAARVEQLEKQIETLKKYEHMLEKMYQAYEVKQ